MNRFRPYLLAMLFLSACGTDFKGALADAEIAHSEKRYIDVVDGLNKVLPKWKDPEDKDARARAFELLGKSYYEMRNTDKAVEAFRMASSTSDKTYDSAYALGNIYLLKNEPDHAIKSFLVALKKRPNDPLALLGLGNGYYMAKQTAAAIATFEKVLDASPGVREAMEQLAVLRARSAKKTYSLPLRGKNRR